MLFSRNYNLQAPLHHWCSQSCTIWGYNNVIFLNIEYFVSNFWVINLWVFLSIPRENGQWLSSKLLKNVPPNPPPSCIIINYVINLYLIIMNYIHRVQDVIKKVAIIHELSMYGLVSPTTFSTITQLVEYYRRNSLREHNRLLVTQLIYPAFDPRFDSYRWSVDS